MADTKNTKQVTLEEIRDLLVEFRNECRVQNEQTLFRLESVLTRRGTAATPKKPVVKKVKADPESKKEGTPVLYSNTLYWWVAMYASNTPSIVNGVTSEDIKNAEDSIEGIKDKPDGYDKQRAIGVALWRGFSKAKRSGELKTMFDNWKKENAKTSAEDVEREVPSDDEKEGANANA